MLVASSTEQLDSGQGPEQVESPLLETSKQHEFDIDTSQAVAPGSVAGRLYGTPKVEISGARATSVISVGGASVNLITSVLGSGILVLPLVFKKCGIILGFVLLTVVALLTYVSSTLYIASMQALVVRYQVPRRTLFAISYLTFGRPGAMLARLAQTQFLMGIATGYIVLIGDILGPFFQRYYGVPPQIVQLIWVVLIPLPLAVLKRITTLRYTSIVTILLYGAIFASLSVTAFKGLLQRTWEAQLIGVDNIFLELFRCLPIVLLSFCVQTQLMPIWQELQTPCVSRMILVLRSSVTIVWGTYFVVTSMAYLAFFQSTQGNILDNFDSSVWLLLAKLTLVFIICFSIPLMVYPIRSEWDLTIFRKRQPIPIWRSAAWSFVILAFAYVLAVVVPSGSVAFGVIGGSAANLLMFIFPGLWFLKVDGQAAVEEAEIALSEAESNEQTPAASPGGRASEKSHQSLRRRICRKFLWIVRGHWKDYRRWVAILLVLTGIGSTFVCVCAIFMDVDDLVYTYSEYVDGG